MPPFFILMSIFVSAFILFVLIKSIVMSIKGKKELDEKVNSYFTAHGYRVNDGNNVYDKVVTNLDEKIYIKYVFVPKNSQITINCKDIWRLSWGGRSANVGRAYPNNRYLGEVREFAKSEFDGKKVFIIYPSTEHILRYLNECELETVDYHKTPYGYKLICFDKFEEQMSEVVSD